MIDAKRQAMKMVRECMRLMEWAWFVRRTQNYIDAICRYNYAAFSSVLFVWFYDDYKYESVAMVIFFCSCYNEFILAIQWYYDDTEYMIIWVVSIIAVMIQLVNIFDHEWAKSIKWRLMDKWALFLFMLRVLRCNCNHFN